MKTQEKEERKKEKKKILFASSETVPFITTADLNGLINNLPKDLYEIAQDIDLRVVIPLHNEVIAKFGNRLEFIGRIYVDQELNYRHCGLFTAKDSEIIYYFIENEYYFKRSDHFDYYAEWERLSFFGKTVLSVLDTVDFVPDIFKCYF